MLKQAMAEVRKIGFGDHEHNAWSDIQFWKIVQLLGTKDEVSFDSVVVNSLFGSNPHPLIQLERAGLISLMYENGRPYSIRSSRPLYSTTFKEMLADDKLVTFMELQTSKHFYQTYQKKVMEFEQELDVLSRIGGMDVDAFKVGVFDKSTPLDSRSRWVTKMIDYYSQKAQANMEQAQKCEQLLRL
jgi:hypothetical protein